MENLQLRKEDEFNRIIKARKVVAQALECGLITQDDIFKLLTKDKNYAFSKAKNYKELLLKQIIISPFVLCDQLILSNEIKEILPLMLQIRYQDEVEELEMMQELDYIDNKELSVEKEMLKYAYYLSSSEGRQILLNGYIDNTYKKNKKTKVLKLNNYMI